MPFANIEVRRSRLPVHVVRHEPPRDNRGIRGGALASDLDLGFALNV